MSDLRRILYHGADPTASPHIISNQAISGCWFELHRQGGCGSGELRLSQVFSERHDFQIGHWISFEMGVGQRWYLGRIEERKTEYPAGTRLRLEGMSVELNQIFPGGFGGDLPGLNPRLFAATDLFPDDPDRGVEVATPVSRVDDLVRILMSYGLPDACHIQYSSHRVETPARPAEVMSLKIRGEESIRSLLKDLALRAQSASWGVDEQGEFFFLRPRASILKTFQASVDLTSLNEFRDLDLLYNRILLTGDYVYDRLENPHDVARKSYRWRGNFVEPSSRSQFGDRRIRIWLPWIRTQRDSIAFSREFFRIYSQPQNRVVIETTAVDRLLKPWEGQIQVLNQQGTPVASGYAETIRVLFDHCTRLRMELGPIDPRTLWPEPPHDERWELPTHQDPRGGLVSLSELSSDDLSDSDESSSSESSDSEQSSQDSSQSSEISDSLESDSASDASGTASGDQSGEDPGGDHSAGSDLSGSGTGGLSSLDDDSNQEDSSDDGSSELESDSEFSSMQVDSSLDLSSEWV